MLVLCICTTVVATVSTASRVGTFAHSACLNTFTKRTVVMCMPQHVHEAYTRKDDAFLWAHQNEPLEETALAMGRGVRSCTARLERLRNPKTEGHRRLFGVEGDNEGKAARLRPVRECIQRIMHDPSLDRGDFSFGYRDRFRKTLALAPFEAPNESVQGGERALMLALPEHRIESLFYRKQLVWHKASRLDHILGSHGGLRLAQVIEGYSEWDEERKQSITRARDRALLALGGTAEATDTLAAFKVLVAGVKAGDMETDAFVTTALSTAYFGPDGGGHDTPEHDAPDDLLASHMASQSSAPSAAHVPAPAVIELMRTIPDAHADTRAELIRELSKRIASAEN